MNRLTTMSRYGLMIIAIVFIAWGCRHASNENAVPNNLTQTRTADQTANLMLDDEFQIDLAPCVLNISVANEEATNFLEQFKLGDAFVGTQNELVASSSLIDVFKTMTSTAYTTGKYFRGLRMIYGATDENKIVLLYVPLYADSASTDSNSWVNFDLNEPASSIDNISGAMYVLNEFNELENIQFNTTAKIVMQDCIDRYRSTFEIKSTTSQSGWRNMINGIDVYAAFVPFQELFDLVKDNAATGINFTSVGKYYAAENIYKHSLVYSPNFSASNQIKMFTDQAANMTSLCPVNCASVSYAPLQ